MRTSAKRVDPEAVLDSPGVRDRWRFSRPGILVPRLWKVSRAYGLTTTRYDLLLRRYESILQRHAAPATFPVTAVALRRHPGIMRRLADSPIELAVHGLTHIDHSKLDFPSQVRRMLAAIRIFQEAGFSPHGFRCPYLWWNEHTAPAAHRAGFTYVSNQVFLWREFDRENVRKLYHAHQNQGNSSLPRTRAGIVEMPVAIPDDFLLADRLSLSIEEISRIWSGLLEDLTSQGGMLALQLHPELISRCGEPLDRVLRDARATGDVWISTLDEVARWWRLKREFSASVDSEDRGFRVTIRVPRGAVATIRDGRRANSRRAAKTALRFGEGIHSVFTPIVPLVAVPDETPDDAVLALRERGYVCRKTRDPSLHAARLTAEDLRQNTVDDWSRRIQATDCPLLELHPWPVGKRSALCVTGDIDAVTLWDQAWRLAGR
jgi:peptidoglycan/xylan/chitin deacetylase (PgdA/CDA1 family)